MERRLALATAVAAAATLGIGTVCFAAIGGGGILGFGGAGGTKSMAPVSEVQTITRVVVVHSADGSVVTDPAGVPVTMVVEVPAPRASVAARSTAAPTVNAAPTQAPTAPPPVGAAIVAPEAATTTSTTTTTVKPTVTTTKPTTTTAKPTTTTRPPGVPADWPAGKAIPPMPNPCAEPQLELNGVWNCGD